MLTSLSLRNFVIVDRLDLEVEGGLTVLTGETGAGKSILIDALRLILGARADAGAIRTGADKTELSAAFSLTDAAGEWLEANDWLDEDDELLLRRTIDRSGRSRGWINGVPATIHQLKELGERLVEINGQHACLALLDPARQLSLIDAFGGHADAVKAAAAAYSDWKQKERALREAEAGREALMMKKERLEWISEELYELDPKAGEWERINAEHARLMNRSALMEGLQNISAVLRQGGRSAMDLIGRAQAKLESLSQYDQKLADLAAPLEAAAEFVEEAAKGIDAQLDRLDCDEGSFERLDARVSQYFDLSLKYKVDPENLFDYYEKVQNDLRAIDEQQNTGLLQARVRDAKDAFDAAAGRLTAMRAAAASDFSRRLTQAARELSLEHATFEARISQGEPSSNGCDRCEFYFSSHPSIPLDSLGKTASGGELARLNLGAATIAPETLPSTVIFDEADVGIGGAAAERVGEKLRELSRDHQILCITHLPQIAGFADQHWQAAKSSDESIVETQISVLDQAGRVAEIARMLSGRQVSDAEKKVAEHILRRNAR